MTRPHPLRRLTAGALATALAATALAGATAGPVAAADADESRAGKTPKALKKLDLTWWSDEVESEAAGSTLPAWSDIVAVGIATEKGESKVRRQLVKRGGARNAAIGPATKVGKKDTVVHVVANLAGKVPADPGSDLVLVVGVNGPGSIPYTTTTRDALTQGSVFAHVLGYYDSQGRLLTGDDALAAAPATAFIASYDPGRAWSTADADLSFDAPGPQIDFDLQGSGAGGLDQKTNSLFTSFVLPRSISTAETTLQIGVYNTLTGTPQTDLLSGAAHTYRVPLRRWANPVDCARVDVFARTNSAGTPTGIYDIKATVHEPVDSAAAPNGNALAFELRGAGPGSIPTEALPEHLPGTGFTFFHGVVDAGSSDPAAIDLTAPGSSGWGIEPEGPAPAIANVFGGIALGADPDSNGTAYGDHDCGNLTFIEGCSYGGGIDYLTGLAEVTGSNALELDLTEFPVQFPSGPTYCVAADAATNEPMAAIGIATRPYTYDGYARTMESNPFGPTPVDIAGGGFTSVSPDGTVIFTWLEPGNVPPSNEGLPWGIRFEVTLLPSAARALGLSTSSDSSAPVYDYHAEYGRQLLIEAGWLDADDGELHFTKTANGDAAAD